MLPLELAVLFADDNPDDLFLIREACKAARFEHPIRTVDDGEEIVAYLERRGRYADRAAFPEPGLIVLDLKMPRLSGFETLERIRSTRGAALPVLILSASSHPGDVARGYALGANAFLFKPSTLEELVDMMGSVKAFWLRSVQFPEPPPA